MSNILYFGTFLFFRFMLKRGWIVDVRAVSVFGNKPLFFSCRKPQGFIIEYYINIGPFDQPGNQLQPEINCEFTPFIIL